METWALRFDITAVTHVQQDKALAKHCIEYVYNTGLIQKAHGFMGPFVMHAFKWDMLCIHAEFTKKSSTSAGQTTEMPGQKMTATTVNEEKPFWRGLEWKNCTLRSFFV